MDARKFLETLIANEGECESLDCKICPFSGARCFISDEETLAGAKIKLAEMDAEEKPKQMTCGVLNELVHAIENDKLIWQNATRTNGDDGSVIFKFECRKPLAQPKTAEDFRDHTLGEVMELGYVVTIKEND